MKRPISVLFSVMLSYPLAAQAAPERHNFPISIANPAPVGSLRNGPLFKKIDTLAYSPSKTALSDALTLNADVRIHPKKVLSRTPVERQKFIQTLLKDCQGPYSIDEGSDWVQTSFVCHVGDGRHIRSYFAFEQSPEVSVEFNFKDGKVAKVFAADLLPLPVPGATKYLPMNAAETLPDKR